MLPDSRFIFEVGVNASYVPATKTFAPVFGGGAGYSFKTVFEPSSQNPNSIANGLGFSATFQPLPFTGSTLVKPPGNGTPVVGLSVGSRIPLSFGAGYNFNSYKKGGQ